MRLFFKPGFALLLTGAVFAAGCGGGGGASNAPRAGAAAKNTYTVKISIPTSSSSTSSTRRKVQYVSPSLQSIVVAILGAQNQQLVQGNNYLNITATGTTSNGDCMTTIAGVTCTLSLSAAIGSGGNFTVVVATYDAQQTTSCIPHGAPACAGNLLSITDMPQNVTPGGTLALALGGIPAYLQGLELLQGYIQGTNNSANNLHLYGPGPQAVKFEFLDAAFNAIIGPGAPTVSVTPLNPSMLTGSISTVANSGIYTLTFNPVTTGSPPLVQPGTASLQFTVSVPNTSLSASATLSVVIAHSAVYAAAQNPTCCTISIYAYFDGNTTNSWTVYNTGNGTIGITTDLMGNLWMADPGNNYVAEWANPQPGSAPGQNNPPGTWSYPWSLAFDVSGNAFVASCGYYACSPATADSLIEYMAPNPQSSPNFSVVGFTNYSNATQRPYQIAVDQSDNVYLGMYDSSVPQGELLRYNAGIAGPTLTEATDPSGIKALAIEPTYGNLWYVTGGSISQVNPGTGLSSGSGFSSGALSGTTGIAFDSVGNLFVANTSGTGVVEYLQPSYTLGPTIGSTSVVSVAVYPNSLIGQGAQVGIPAVRTPVPLPIPTPT